MAGSLGEAQLQLTVDDRAFKAGLNKAQAEVGKFTGQTVQNFDRIGASLRNIAIGLGSAAVVQQIAAIGQESERSKIQLEALAGAYNEVAQAQASAARIAKVLSISNLEARQGFSQLYAALRGTGISVEQLEVLYVGLNKAARLSGAGSQEAAGALLQLKQGLASGVLAGDELRSVLENMPALTQALAKEMGVTVGQIKKLGSEGKITSVELFRVAKSLAAANAPAKTASEQLGATFTNVKEKLAEAFGPALQQLIAKAGGWMLYLADSIDKNKQQIQAFVTALVDVGKKLLPVAIGIGTVVSAFKAWQIAVKAAAVAQSALLALSGPAGWAALGGAVAAGAAAFAALNKLTKDSEKAMEGADKEAKKLYASFSTLLNRVDDVKVNPTKNAEVLLKNLKERVTFTEKLIQASERLALGQAAQKKFTVTEDVLNVISEYKGAERALRDAKNELAIAQEGGNADAIKKAQEQVELSRAIFKSATVEAVNGFRGAFEKGLEMVKDLKRQIDDLRDAINDAKGGADGVNKYIDPGQAQQRQLDANGALFARAKDIASQLGVSASFSGSLVERNQQMSDFIRAGVSELRNMADLNKANIDLDRVQADLASASTKLAEIVPELVDRVNSLIEKDWNVQINAPSGYVTSGDVNRFMN